MAVLRFDEGEEGLSPDRLRTKCCASPGVSPKFAKHLGHARTAEVCLFKTFFGGLWDLRLVLHDNYIGPLKGRRHPLQQAAYLRNLIEFWMLANYVGCHLLL